jgi:hypothetical protein
MTNVEPNIIYPVIDSYIAKHHLEQLAYEEAKRDMIECLSAKVILDEVQAGTRARANVQEMLGFYRRTDVAILNDVLTDDNQVFEYLYCKAYVGFFMDFKEILERKEGN